MKRHEKINLIHTLTGWPIQHLVRMSQDEIKQFFLTVTSWKDGEETA